MFLTPPREIYRIKDQVDILFVGSSHTGHGIDESVFIENNLKVHKLAFPGGRPSQMLTIFDIFLKYNPKPKLVVIDVSWESIARPNIFNQAETFLRLKPWDALPFFLASEGNENEIKVFLNSLGRSSYFLKYIFKNKESSKDDALPRRSIAKFEQFLIRKNRTNINKIQLLSLEKLVQQLKTLSIPVALVEIPEYSFFLNGDGYSRSKFSEISKGRYYSDNLKQKALYSAIQGIAFNNKIPYYKFDTGETMLFRTDPFLFNDLEHIYDSYPAKLFSRILMSRLNMFVSDL